MSKTGFMTKIQYLYCTECKQPVVVGHSMRDEWFGMCKCEVEQLPKIRATVDFEDNHVDMTGEVEIPVESWEKTDSRNDLLNHE